MAGKRAFLQWQEEISRHCEALREVTLSFATFDCLLSLAKVAIGSGTDYSRPQFVDRSTLDLEGARHPMVCRTTNLLTIWLTRSYLVRIDDRYLRCK
jgi:DNA mismatch repair ATPase MutS